MHRELRDSVVVITGASSGIGRATALEFAGRGARLVLAARRVAGLEQAAADCRRAGARVEIVPTDVTDQQQVEALAERAVREFGRIDTWVSDAAVVAFGTFMGAPVEAFRRVIDTNLFGFVYGARAALRQFERQGSGVLIEVASVLGKEGVPYLGSYVASKEAAIGLAACLREEFQGTEIEICTILPASIDTPIWQHGANYTGRAVQPIKPVYEPEDVARAIVGCAERPQRIRYVGVAGRLVTYAHGLSPELYERVAKPVIDRALFRGRSAERSDGNLFSPSARTSVRGGWKRAERGGRRWLPIVAGLGAAVAASVAWRLRPHSSPRARIAKKLIAWAGKIAA